MRPFLSDSPTSHTASRAGAFVSASCKLTGRTKSVQPGCTRAYASCRDGARTGANRAAPFDTDGRGCNDSGARVCTPCVPAPRLRTSWRASLPGRKSARPTQAKKQNRTIRVRRRDTSLSWKAPLGWDTTNQTGNSLLQSASAGAGYFLLGLLNGRIAQSLRPLDKCRARSPFRRIALPCGHHEFATEKS